MRLLPFVNIVWGDGVDMGMAMKGNVRLRVLILAISGAIAAVAVALVALHYIERPISLKGAIVKQDADPRKQSPITDVEVTAADNLAPAAAKSDFSGYFRMTLRPFIKRNQTITLRFRHQDYQPVDLKTVVSDKLYVVHMSPAHPESDAQPNHPAIPVANVFVRYSIEASTSVNIGTGLKTFQIQNASDVACEGHPPCSPDGKWKATVGSASLDAGPGNAYDDARLSCIAGPCPFTKVIIDEFSHGGRNISVSILNWSDTTTFLLQAEVFRHEVSDIVRESYPVIFGDSLNFTLPAAAEGQSFEAEISGEHIVFPLGPSPLLSWATCNVQVGRNRSKTYRCELKPGYQFR
jgi:hypothetical protein